MADFGMKISKKDKSVSSATGQDLFFDGKYPFAKLDRTRTASFQDIRLAFVNAPPIPGAGGAAITTNVYQFAHGYSYKPQMWVMGQRIAEPTTATPGLPYFKYFHRFAYLGDFGTIIYPQLEIWHDVTNVYFSVTTFDNSFFGGAAMDLRGLILQIRVFIFAEDLTSTNSY